MYKFGLFSAIMFAAAAVELFSTDSLAQYGGLGVCIIAMGYAIRTLYQNQREERAAATEGIERIVERHTARMDRLSEQHAQEMSNLQGQYSRLVEKIAKIEDSQ
jgi:hypothetical protein